MPTTAFTSDPSTVTVTGTATATAVPDIVRLTIGVSVTQTAVSDAFDAVARLSTALTETLHARGVRGADLTTAGLSVHPQTHWSDGGRQETTGFTASTTFRVVLRELEPEAANSPAAVIAACVSVGGDAIRLDGLEFDLDDRSDLATRARELAWTAAESKARQFADLADRADARTCRGDESGFGPDSRRTRRDRRIDLGPRSMGYGVTTVIQKTRPAVDQPGLRISE